MTKEAIKYQLQQAVKTLPYRDSIKSVALFGSYITGQPTDDSDVDVLIELYPDSPIGFFELYDIQQALERSLGKPVDLLTPEAISRYIRPQVLRDAECVYER